MYSIIIIIQRYRLKDMEANTSTNAYALINGPVIFESSSEEQFKDFEKRFPTGSNALKLITEPVIFEKHVQEVIDLYYAAMKKYDD